MYTGRAVITVRGKDQKGAVARFATHLADHGVNILDIEQQVVHGQFIMDMLVDLSDLDLSLDGLRTQLQALGQRIDMETRLTLHERGRPPRVAVLVSREPHCLEQILEDRAFGRLRGEVVGVLSNHPNLEPTVREAGLSFDWKKADAKQAHFDWLHERLHEMEPDLIVLARYMQIIPSRIVRDYPHRIINIHPSLLPCFPGARPYTRAWEQGVRVSGCTAHFVTEELDQGPIILQDVFHIEVGRDAADDVKHKGRQLEGRVLSQALQMALDEKLAVVDDKVVFRPGLSSFLD